MPVPTPFAQSLRDRIDRAGGLSLADYMAACSAHYYATRNPLGRAGDFITAPEISQMFGELIGLCVADLWVRAGGPTVRFVELGAGRGTLAVDALRAMRQAGLAPASIELVETSPLMRAHQAERLPHARWHEAIETLPTDLPLIVVANEFFDALPIRQLVRTNDGWRERMIVGSESGLLWSVQGRNEAEAVPPSLRDVSVGAIVERSPAAATITRTLGERVARQGGAVIVIDYGYAGPLVGETLQAVCRHRHADPLAAPGEQDLTAHVDFTALAQAASQAGSRVLGPVPQGILLDRLGIDHRAAALRARNPQQGATIEAARARLVLADAMGTLFKALAIVAPDWPDPAGFT